MSLRGLKVVLTRPAGQNEDLALALRKQRAEAIVFPVLAIVDEEDSGAFDAALARLGDYDLALFISPNATQRAMARIRARAAWPARLQAATIGPASAQALREHGVENVLVPDGRYDSEALLALPELQNMGGKRVVIFRGRGGRELLGDTLRERGASVDYAECYRRAVPTLDSAPLRAAGARRPA